MKMDFMDELPVALIEQLREKREYLKAIEVVVATMRSNLIRMEAVYGKDAELRSHYNAVSYFGKDSGLRPETEERILQLVLVKYSLYMKRIRHILEQRAKNSDDQ